jgi:hypothetical protein
MAVNMKITVFWDVTTHTPVERYQHCGRLCCLYLHGRSKQSMEQLIQIQEKGGLEPGEQCKEYWSCNPGSVEQRYGYKERKGWG